MAQTHKRSTDSMLDFASIFALAPYPCVLLDHDMRVVAMNEAYGKLMGLDVGSGTGKVLFTMAEVAQCSIYCQQAQAHFKHALSEKTTSNMPPCSLKNADSTLWAGSFSPLAASGHVIHQLAEIPAAIDKLDSEQDFFTSRAYLKNIINTVVDPIFVKDREHRWIEGNNSMWQLFGRKEKEVIGRSDYDFFPKEEADIFWQKDEEVFTSGKANENEEKLTDAQGKTHIISTKKSCFTTPGGQQILVGVIRDITEIRQIEERLKESDQARLKAIMDHSGCFVYIKDVDGKYITLNKDLLGLMGKEEREVVGLSDHDFFSAEYADEFRKNDLQVIGQGTSIEFEETVMHPDGTEHVYRSVKFPLYDANCRIYAICGLSTDVTERKKAEVAAALLASIVASSDDAIISEGLDGVVTSWNNGAERLFGYASDEMLGQHISKIIPPERSGEEFELIKQLQGGKPIRGFETLSLTKDGRKPNISLTMSPMLDANGRMIGVSRVARDITQQKEVQAQLLHYTWELERSNQELDDFAYIASHDLKEPLRGLFNHASFLLEDYGDKLDEDAKHRLNRLSTLAQRMETLINDLLYFSRLGRTELAIRETDPNEIVEEIKQMLDGVLHEYGAEISVPVAMPVIVCDKPRITEAFRNLITNAIKYNDKPQKTVEVGFLDEVQSKTGNVKNVFYVKDNGIGIAPEFHEEIFRIFKRLSKPANEKNAGTGVGLTFVKKIIERHNGQIWLDSEPGKGSTFYFAIGKKQHG